MVIVVSGAPTSSWRHHPKCPEKRRSRARASSGSASNSYQSFVGHTSSRRNCDSRYVRSVDPAAFGRCRK